VPAATKSKTKQQLAAEVMALVLRLKKENVREHSGDLRPYDLTTQQVWLLAELPEHEGVPTGALADALQCHGSNVTGMVDRLEARGLVVRQASTADRRVKFVELTEAGRALRDEVVEIARRPPRVLLERLDTEQLRALQDLLAAVCDGLE
jgi:MarR family transcriptional regulator, organic hydroperoxide resistance regulator